MKKAFVVGHPILHSLSPQIYNYWFDLYNIDASYELIDKNEIEFTSFIQNFKQDFIGGNVTLPHKERALMLADKAENVAKKIGAANLLWMEDDILWASNSDAYGFFAALEDFVPEKQIEKAYVLGAGGAARAVIYALLHNNCQKIYLINRTLQRAQKLAEHFGSKIEIVDFEDRHNYLNEADLIVNTTSISLDSNKIFPLNFAKAKETAIAYDLVYRPLETNFLQQAKKYNLKTIDGLNMLLYQAVLCFEKLFNIKPIVDKNLRQHILKFL